MSKSIPSFVRAAAGAIRSTLQKVDLATRRISFRVRLSMLGVVAVVAVACCQWRGWLAPLETGAYDARVRLFGPKSVPTTRFVHVDVDDGSLAALGPWPWPRRIMADAIDVLNKDGQARIIAIDLLYPERKKWAGVGAMVSGGETDPLDSQPEAEDDQLLIDAAERAKDKLVLPVSFTWNLEPHESDVVNVVSGYLKARPFDPSEAVRDYAFKTLGKDRSAEIDRIIHTALTDLRQEVVLNESLGLARKDSGGDHSDRPRARTPALRIVDPFERLREQGMERARAIVAMWDRFAFPGSMPAGLLKTRRELVPIEPLVVRSAGAGFADYIPEPDGIVRSVPLWVSHRDHVFPQFGLAVALADLGVRPGSSLAPEFRSDRVTLRPPRGPVIEIPVHVRGPRGAVASVATNFLIPWSGTDNWLTMYGEEGTPNHVEHIPFARVWQVADFKNRLAHNRRVLADAMQALSKRYLAEPPAPPSPELARRILASDDLRFEIGDAVRQESQSFAGMSDQEANQARQLLAWFRVVEREEQITRTNLKLEEELNAARQDLERQVRGRVVILGWAATGAAADFVPTSLHAKCPGAAVHGAIYNAIMTRNMWSRAPPVWNYAATLAVGLIATWIMFMATPDPVEGTGPAHAGRPPDSRPSRLRRVGRTIRPFRLRPLSATVLGVSAIAAWVLFNAQWLFARNRVVVDVIPPVVAGLSVWSLGIAALASERFRMMHLLRGYVDPKLVSFLSRYPEAELFNTREADVTVCFSDIKGFTRLTQELGSAIVPLLQEYLSLMVEVIRKNGGVVNKFMGDGIMFIFGVPSSGGDGQPQPEQERRRAHAAAALRCVLEMQRRLDAFNREKQSPDPGGHAYPPLVMRCGVNTGPAFVGDAGPSHAREFTALGDTTNVAARLETANKDCGTRILVSQATKLAVIESEFCFSPIGKLKLRNRDGLVDAFELCGEGPAGSSRETERTQLLRTIVDEFQRRHFPACLENLDELEQKFGKHSLVDLYRSRCQAYLSNPDDDFDGHIIEQS